MIKIEITDPHLMDTKAVHDLCVYLMNSKGVAVIPVNQERPKDCEIVPEAPKLDIDNTDKELNESEAMTVEVKPEQPAYTIPPAPVSADVFNPFAVNPSLTASVVDEEETENSDDNDPNKEDSRGFKWDSRIHARTKSKNVDGTWRYQRGMQQEKINKIEAEATQIKLTPPAVFVPPAPPAPPIAAPSTVSNDDFPALMSLITGAISLKKLKRDDVNAILQGFGIPSLPVAASRPDLIPKIIQAINEVL